MFGQPENNPNDLRVIKTARTEDTINAAARDGYRPLLKPVIPCKKIQNMVAVYQHRTTGEIELSGDLRWSPGPDYDLVIPYISYYQYNFPSPFAAYLIPSNLAEGERVWLEDIIEDIVAVHGNQGWFPRLESGEAIWSQGDFQVQFDPDKDAPQLLG